MLQVDAKTGRSGYAPAWVNEWVHGVCEKPRVKCGDSSNQAFFSVSDRALLDHLPGNQVFGVYSLLQDETCWLLAVDIDSPLNRDFGVFVATLAVGKTVAGAYLPAERGCSTLVLVHRQPLLEQWFAQLSPFLDIESKVIGRIGGGKRRITGRSLPASSSP